MIPACFRSLFVATVVSVLAMIAVPAGAQNAPQVEQPAPPATIALSQDARETRQELEAVLKRLPPSVGRVLRTDPSLMRNQSYLTTYPTLAAFLQQHPEVANNPGYYLENITVQFWQGPSTRDPRSEAIMMWRNTIEGLWILLVFLVITAGVLWLVRSALNHRRWNRVFKAQTDMHGKVMDRLTSNEDLLAYIQSPGGRQFLETVALPVEASPRPLFTPHNRIFWSVQAGLVLAALAIGLIFVSNRVIEEVSEVFFAAGVLALALGIGFVASAAASLLLSQRLGLLDPSASREHSRA